MIAQYTFVPDLSEQEIPTEGILSRTIHEDPDIKVVLFAFGEGEELSEHTASKPAVLHFLKGNARLGLGGDTKRAEAGAWVHMPARLAHSIKAETPLLLLLVLLKNTAACEQ